jgi:uncharacterized protein YjiS (DUF1127 family)
MAFASTDTHHAAQRHSGGSLATNLRRRWTQWLLYRRTLEELSSLSPRELSDLGLSSYDLRAVAREAVYGEGAPYSRG